MSKLGDGMYVACHIGDLMLGIALDRVQEINRMVDATFVPRMAKEVRGLINLRGSLVSVLDLGRILFGITTKTTAQSRNVIVDLGDEKVGLLVDAVGDVVDCRDRPIEPLPSHVEKQHGRWFKGLVQLDRSLLLVLDVETVASVGVIKAMATARV